MATFKYVAVNKSGKEIKGAVEAVTKQIAIDQIKKQGLIIRSLNEQKKGLLDQELVFGNPVSVKDFVIFCRQFSVLFKSGVAMTNCISILAQQSDNKYLKKTLVEIEEDIRKGNPLSKAVGKHTKIFPPIFINMVKAGEVSGKLDDVLEGLATFFEKENTTKEKVKSAMTYPGVVGFFALVIIAFLLYSVVPQFVNNFAASGQELPFITKAVMTFSNSLVSSWYFYIIGIILIVVGFKVFTSRPEGKYWLDYFKIKAPIFGTIVQKSLIARFSRTFSSLFASSVPVIETLTICQKVVDNAVIVKVLEEAKKNLQNGRPLSEPIEKSWVFPKMVGQMIKIGEQTGSIDSMLVKIADFYEQDVDNTVDKLKSLIEPLMLLIVSAMVGVIIAAIMLPMFAQFESMK